jgi:hypothetical protein
VDIDFGQGGQILSITAVSESEIANAKAAAAGAGQKSGASFLSKIAARFGVSKMN